MAQKSLLLFCILSALSPTSILADEQQTLQQQLEFLKAEISRLESRIAEQELASNATVSAKDTDLAQPDQRDQQDQQDQKDGIRVGGAVRTNFSHTSYNEGNKNRGGDFAFDIFRLNLHGSVGEVTPDAEIRFFDYLTAMKYAYAGYRFNEDWQVQAGITQVPFGNWPYNSHKFFSSTNYYIGLEDDHDLGIEFKRQLKDD